MVTVDITHLMLGVLTATAVLYAAWSAYYLTKESRRTKRGGKEGNREAELPPKRRKGDIIGKSLFVLKERVTLPQATVEPDNEADKQKEDIFAPSNVPGHSRQIPPEELDEVFGDVPDGETNEPLDIDFPLSEEPFPEDEARETEDTLDDEDEALPLTGASTAKGVRFEQIGEAYRQVVHNQSEITDEQMEETGRILLDLKGTDMFEAIVSGKPGGKAKVSRFMNAYIEAFHRRMSLEKGETDSPDDGVPSGFDVRKFAKPLK